MDWKRRLSIARTSKELTCVIQDFAPSTPNKHSMQDERDTYHNWHKVHQKAILGSLNNVLQHRHKSMATTYDILLSFHEIFGGKGKTSK